MNEEMNFQEIETTEDNFMETYEPESSGKGVLGKLIIGALVVGAGVTAIALKNKDRLEKRRIRKLEKKGYVVTKAEVIDVPKECVNVVETEE